MGYIVTLVASPAPLSTRAAARLAGILSTDAYSIRLAMNRARPLVLGRAIEQSTAETAVAVLTQLGHEAYALSLDEMRDLGEPLRPRTLKFTRAQLGFVMSEAEMRLSTWDNLFLLVFGRCRSRVRERTWQSPRIHTYGLGVDGGITESSSESVTEKLDIYFYDGSIPVRIDCSRFSFAFLGEKIGPSDSQSLARTVRGMRKLAPHIVIDQDFEQFRRSAGAVGGGGVSEKSFEFRLPGNLLPVSSKTRQEEDDAPRFDFYSRLTFFIHLRRAERAARGGS